MTAPNDTAPVDVGEYRDKLRDLILSACYDLGLYGLESTPNAAAAVASLVVNASKLGATVDALAEVERLRAENERLRADAARLDWLEEHAATVLPIFNQAPDDDDDEAWHVRAEDSANGDACGASLRATIDAAQSVTET